MTLRDLVGDALGAFRFCCLVGLLSMQFIGSAVAQGHLPTLVVVHEDFLKRTTLDTLVQTLNTLSTRGVFKVDDSLQVRLSSCKSTAAPPDVVIFNDQDILQFAVETLPETAPTLAWLKKLDFNYKSRPGMTRDAVAMSNPWTVLASDRNAMSLVKAFGLREKDMAPADADSSSLRFVKNPMVLILLPVPGIYQSDPRVMASAPIQVPFNSSVKGWYQPVDEYIVLANGSLKTWPGAFYSEFTDTLAHEIGHYLGLPHVYVEERDQKSSIAGVAWSAELIQNRADCARPDLFIDGQIRDVDFYKTDKTVGDTISYALGRRAECMRAYADLLLKGWMDPQDNLMMHSRRGDGRGDGRRDQLLTAMQVSRLLAKLAEIRTATGPTNLCADMASVKLKRKTPAGPPGNFKFEFECTCPNGTKHAIEVTSANDNQANQLAQQECEEMCGKS